MAVKLIVKNNGSLRVEGEVELYDANGNAFDLAGRTAFSLCRCGKTENAPFCDGSHGRCNFESVVVARALPPPKGS